MVVSAAVASAIFDKSLIDPAVPFNRAVIGESVGRSGGRGGDAVAGDALRECGEYYAGWVAAAEANVFFTVGLP